MTDTLREKAMKPEEVEFARLVSLGMDEAKANEQWLSGTASIKLTPFARDGLAHSFGLLLDRIEKLERALEPFADAYSEASNDAKQLGVDDKLRAAWVMNLLDWEDFETASDIIEALRSEKP